MHVNSGSFRCPQTLDITVEAFETLLSSREPFDWSDIWPKLKTLDWTTSQDHLQFLRHFLTLNVRNLKIQLEGVEDEEVQEVLSLVESRCMNLEDLRLPDSESRDNEEIQDTIRQIIYNNSLTLRLFYPPQDPSASLVGDILMLPVLQVLEMHIPEMPDPPSPGILPALEYLTFTLDEAADIIDLLGTLRESKLRQFSLICPYPASEDHEQIARFFDHSGLHSSVQNFSWEPPLHGGPLTWGFITTLSRFANMRALSLEFPCGQTCRFNFSHENIVRLSLWMPRLRELNFGGSPCAGSSRVTNIGYQTLAVLAKNCPNLVLLAIHFNIRTFMFRHFVKPNWNVAMWDIGDIPPPNDPEALTMFALAVSSLFPKVTFIGATGKNIMKWNEIHEEIRMLTLPANRGLLDLM